MNDNENPAARTAGCLVIAYPIPQGGTLTMTTNRTSNVSSVIEKPPVCQRFFDVVAADPR